MQQPPPGIRTLNPAVPEALARVISRCLEPDAKARYASTQDLEADLQRLDDNGNLLPGAATRQHAADRRCGCADAEPAGGHVVALITPVTPPAPAPVSVLVADFENRTGEPVFEGSLEQALAIAMEGASFITSYNSPGGATPGERRGADLINARRGPARRHQRGPDRGHGPRGSGYRLSEHDRSGERRDAVRRTRPPGPRRPAG